MKRSIGWLEGGMKSCRENRSPKRAATAKGAERTGIVGVKQTTCSGALRGSEMHGKQTRRLFPIKYDAPAPPSCTLQGPATEVAAARPGMAQRPLQQCPWRQRHTEGHDPASKTSRAFHLSSWTPYYNTNLLVYPRAPIAEHSAVNWSETAAKAARRASTT